MRLSYPPLKPDSQSHKRNTVKSVNLSKTGSQRNKIRYGHWIVVVSLSSTTKSPVLELCIYVVLFGCRRSRTSRLVGIGLRKRACFANLKLSAKLPVDIVQCVIDVKFFTKKPKMYSLHFRSSLFSNAKRRGPLQLLGKAGFTTHHTVRFTSHTYRVYNL